MLSMSTKAIQIGTLNRNSPQLNHLENFVSVLSGALQDWGGGGGLLTLVFEKKIAFLNKTINNPSRKKTVYV